MANIWSFLLVGNKCVSLGTKSLSIDQMYKASLHIHHIKIMVGVHGLFTIIIMLTATDFIFRLP